MSAQPQDPAPLPPRVTRRAMTFTLLVVAGNLALFWILLWMFAAHETGKSLNAWLEAEKKAGHEVAFQTRHNGGFPFYFKVLFKDFHWKDQQGESLHAPALTLRVSPLSFSVFTLLMPDGAVGARAWDGKLYELTAKEAEVTLALPKKDRAMRLDRFSVTNAKLTENGPTILEAGRASFALSLPASAPKDHKEVGLTFRAQGQDLTLHPRTPGPLGETLEALDLQGRVMGPLPTEIARRPLAAWNDASGVVEIDGFSLTYGPLSLTAKGTLALSPRFELEGALTAQLEGTDAALVLAQKARFLDENAANLARQILSQTSKDGLALSLQGGALYAGPLRFGSVPALPIP